MPKRQFWIIVALYALLSIAVLWYFKSFPSIAPGTDARAYIEQGRLFRLHGFLSELGDIRTYGYPLVTYLVSFVTGATPSAIALVTGATQLALYGAIVCAFVNRIADEAPTLATALTVGLLLNPMLIVLVGDVLTDGPSLILAVTCLLCLHRSARAPTTWSALAWAAMGALASNFALMVRPANLTVLIAYNIGLAVSFLAPRKGVQRSWVCLGYLVAWLGTAAAAWAPQVAHNASIGHLGVFPPWPLLKGQIQWGIVFLRYGTIIDSHGLPVGLFFPNPSCIDPGANPDLTWYVVHPLNGLATIAGHILSAFSFNYPFTYIYDLSPFYSLPAAVVTWAIATLGLLHGAWLVLWCRLANPLERAATITAVAILFVLGIGVLAFVVVENRFAAIPLAILSVLAAHFVLTYEGKPRGALALTLLAAALGAGFSDKERQAAFKFPESGLEYRCVADWSRKPPFGADR